MNIITGDYECKYKKYKQSSIDKFGISTASFYPMDLEKAFDRICFDIKYKVCEIFINTSSETEENFLREIKLKADDNGVNIISVHPYFSGYESFLFFTDYRRRINDSIKLYRPFFEAAAFWESKYIIFHGLRITQDFAPERYAEIFLMIADEAKKYGVELLQENVANTHSSSPAFIGEISQIAESWNKKIRFVLDFKHAVVAGEDILGTADAMGENLAHIHFNDISMTPAGAMPESKVQSCKLPFFGNLNYDAIFKKLFDINYIGNFITEVYRNNYATEEDIIESKKRFCSFCENS